MVPNGIGDGWNIPRDLMTSMLRDSVIIFTLRLCVLCICACVSLCQNPEETLVVAIFAPVTCADADMYKGTIKVATDDARRFLARNRVNITHDVYDSCDEADAITTIIQVTQAHRYDVIIGPGHMALCEVTARLAQRYSVPLISWRCTDNVLQSRDVYTAFSRTVPSTRDISQAITKALYHFKWKNVALLSLNTDPYMALTNDIHLSLNEEDFEVQLFQEMTSDISENDITTVFSKIPTDVKAVFLCTDIPLLRAIMKAVEESDLLSSQRAYFYLDALTALRTSSLLQFPPILPTSAGNGTASMAEESLLILKTHSFDIAQHVEMPLPVLDKLLRYDEDLYNSVQLAVQAAIDAVQNGHRISTVSISTFAQNLTFTGLHGGEVHVTSGQTMEYFTLWDYVKTSDFYELAVQIEPSGHIETIQPITWPHGAPEPDTCLFMSCEALAPVYILVIIIVALTILGGGGTSLAFFVRRRIHLREMERGPNKILLNSDDLVFFVPKSKSASAKSFHSNSVHFIEKPDLIKGSEPSMSVDSIFGDHMEFGDTARYLGDLVFIKELRVKGFELSSKLRSYLKTLRDARHENINPFVGCYVDQIHPSFVFEFCSRRSLEDVIANEDITLDWDFKLSLLTDLVKGMKYLHASPVRVHGCLKSGNLVIDSRWVLKVTDYGVSGTRDRFGCSRTIKAKELLWTAPEILRDPELLYHGTQKADVFSFAIILQELILRGHPYCMLNIDAEDIIKKIRKPPPLCRPSVSQGAAPPQYIQIMKQCWTEMPDMRPTFDQINSQIKEINKGRKLNIVDTMFKMLEKYSNDLEEIVRERTTALEDEKKKTEHLLSQMLPKVVAESLMMGKPVEAEDFDDVTIYFSDIVGFTTISAMSTPLQVVDLLNDLYTMFDTCMDHYDVYKVETIGDAYMVVSGLPGRNGIRHAGEICSLSLDILSSCGQFRIKHMPDLPCRLRIGLHTGQCVAGVVGLRMPRYCLFGDTVNTASRMESTGAAFRIHVSQMTKDRLDELGGYHTQYRGETELKGKGVHKTYWLIGKEGFSKPLPEPPPINGLGTIVDQKKLQELCSKVVDQNKNNSNVNVPGPQVGEYQQKTDPELNSTVNLTNNHENVPTQISHKHVTSAENAHLSKRDSAASFTTANKSNSSSTMHAMDYGKPTRYIKKSVRNRVASPLTVLSPRRSPLYNHNDDGALMMSYDGLHQIKRSAVGSTRSLHSTRSLDSESGMTSLTPIVMEERL